MPQSPLKYAVAFLLGGAVFSGATYLRTHEPNDAYDSQAGSNLWCDDTITQSVTNDSGLVLIAHSVNCDVLGSSIITYVYLQLNHQTRSRVNLVLRYDGSDPELSWLDSKHAVVKASDVVDVSKQVTRLFGIDIIFDLKKLERKPE